MKPSIILAKGEYLGKPVETLTSFGFRVSINEYSANTPSNWHDHENSYFAFIAKGGTVEVRKKFEIECIPGALIFCRAGEIHKNLKYKPKTKILHVTIDNEWYRKYDLAALNPIAAYIRQQEVQQLFVKLFTEMSQPDSNSIYYTEGMLLQAYSLLNKKIGSGIYGYEPRWVKKFKTNFFDASYDGDSSLLAVAQFLNIHPVTLSSDFKRFFGCNFSEFMQRKKLEKSLQMLTTSHVSIESVALECGFSDSSYYTKCFRKTYGFTPSEFRLNCKQ